MKTVSQSFEAAGVQSAAPTVNSFSALFEWRRVVIGSWVFAGYYLGAKIGFALTFQPHPVSVLWPPNSILVAALLLTPPRIWWFILLAAFPAHCAAQLQSHVPPLMILCWFISNSCEALIGAGLTRYLVGGPIRFTTLRNVGIFCLCVVVIGPFLSSFLDAAFVVWNHWGGDSYWELIRIRLFSNALAALIVVPLVVTWATTGIQSLWTARLSRYLEGCALFVGLLLVSYAVLYEFGSGVDSALLFLPLPFLLWAAVRFGALGASTATSIVGFLAIWSAAHGHGPFSGGTAEQNALSIQTFLIVLAIPLLFLATVIEERATRETELRESEARINLAANVANLGLWFWKIPSDELWVTEQWRRLFGFADLEPVTFDRLLQVVHPGDRERMKELVQHMFEQAGEYESEYRITRPDGSTRWIAGHGSVELDEHGKPAYARGVSRDVTRRKQGEEALLESEARFRTMADTAPVLIWVSGEDKLCTYVNKAWLEFTGRSMKENLGNGWSEALHPDDVEKALQTYSSAFDAREPFVMQYRLKRNDGEYRRITDQGVPRYGPRGNFRGYVGACVDITDLLEKERALREFEERVTLAAEAAHVGVWELNMKTNELWMSDKARELFGFAPEELITHKKFQDRVHPEDRALRDSAVQHAIETQSGYEIEYRTTLADGTVRWIGARARCVGDEDGALTRLLGVSMDVTAQKQSRELFRMATEASPSGIVVIDDQGRIVLVNSHVEELFGYNREELLEKRIEILVPERYASQHPEHRANFFAAPTARVIGAGRELFGRRKDGSEFPVEIGLSPIQTPEGMLVLAAVVDISARKLAEAEAIQHREEVGHLSRLAVMGELTASIAHELNQPLSGIISNASAGQRFIDRGNVDLRELRELLADIVADGRRAGEVIRGVRNMVKKGSRVRQRVNLNELATNVVRMVKSDAMLRSCDLDTLLEPDLPSIEGDPIQLQQVLLNLLVNAFDAMRDTPLSRRKVVIVTERNGNDAILTSVRDYGIGIPAEVRDRLFDHFFTTKPRGLGMGLAIVRSIVESHSGTIAGENAEGGGARFHFTLPVSRERAAHSAI
jgi:PAS domain S-box-containing protein